MKIFFSLLLIANCCWGFDFSNHQQLLVVTTKDWKCHTGILQRYEKSSAGSWKTFGKPIPVVLGKNGLAWGIGLYQPLVENSHLEAGIYRDQFPQKAEGDKKSPAGIFSLGNAFGLAAEMPQLKMDYIPLNKFTEAVDDSNSIYYNCIVNREDIPEPDWKSSEKMGDQPLYKMGLVINHNFPNPQKGAGSAIFFHIWEGEDIGTSGCTAMSEKNLRKVLYWLDSSKSPLLVQLPFETIIK